MADDQKQVVSERNIPHSPGIVPKKQANRLDQEVSR
jgi:hypothetical protein